MSNTAQKPKAKGMDRFFDFIERTGNKLPTPFMLFVYLTIATAALSAILSYMGVSVTYMAAGKDGVLAETTVAVKNLFSSDVLYATMKGFVSNYVSFAPLGIIIVMMFGIALIDYTGLVRTLVKKTLLGAPTVLITFALAFVGANASIASNAGWMLAMVLGGTIFGAIGRNPLAGVIIGNAGFAGGFCANLLVTGSDAMLAGITQGVAQGAGIPHEGIHPLINWYFLMISTVTVAFVIVLVAKRFTFTRLDQMYGIAKMDVADEDKTVSAAEMRGLKFAGIACVIFILILLCLTVPEHSFFRSPEGKILPSSPFMDSLMFLLFAFFTTVGIAYGIGAGVIKSEKDISLIMAKGVNSVASFLVVSLSASLFIKLFNTSNITTIIAVNGAELLKKLHLGGIPLAVLFIILVAIANLFLVSGSAKWMIFAPIFVPMFFEVGFSPALTQMAYRIGDSVTNIISHLSTFIPVVLGIMEQYNPKKEPIKMGTYISLMLPYSVAIFFTYTIQLIIWMIFKLPLGPGAGI